jgi:hypothetical protein
MKTPDEIATEITKLKAIKPRLKRKTMFGDDLHDAVDAQIEVLEKRMGNDAIYDRWEATANDDCDMDEGRTEHALSCALDALRWLEEEEESPSSGWEEIAS